MMEQPFFSRPIFGNFIQVNWSCVTSSTAANYMITILGFNNINTLCAFLSVMAIKTTEPSSCSMFPHPPSPSSTSNPTIEGSEVFDTNCGPLESFRYRGLTFHPNLEIQRGKSRSSYEIVAISQKHILNFENRPEITILR
jgi:hypothetical protein